MSFLAGCPLIASFPSAPCAAVLENRHVACLYSLLPSRPDIDIFSRLEPAQWREVGAVPCCAGPCYAVLCVLSYFAAGWLAGWPAGWLAGRPCLL